MYIYSSTVTILPFSTLNESFYQYVYLFHSRTNLKEDKIQFDIYNFLFAFKECLFGLVNKPSDIFLWNVHSKERKSS